MKLGLIARADTSRGLGAQTHGFYRHLNPAKVMIVDLREYPRNAKYRHDFDAYPEDSLVVPVGGFEEHKRAIRDWLDGLDVVLTCETPYWLELYDMALKAKVGTVCQVNPEFFEYRRKDNKPRPTILVAPTIWRLKEMRDHAHVRHLPYPVDRERFPFTLRSEVTTFCHVHGHTAYHDRNGTRLLFRAMRVAQPDIHCVVRSQSPLGSSFSGRRHRATLEIEVGDLPDPADLYAGADAMVLPRRYAGQCLPMMEALSMGLPVICLDRTPENTWGGTYPVRSREIRRGTVKENTFEIHDADPKRVAEAMRDLNNAPDLVERLSKEADDWADSVSWAKLRPTWVRLLEEAASEA